MNPIGPGKRFPIFCAVSAVIDPSADHTAEGAALIHPKRAAASVGPPCSVFILVHF